jgi:hypothetical protein
VVIFPGEVLAFQNIERQTHALRAPALGTVVETPPAAAPDPGEDDFEGEPPDLAMTISRSLPTRGSAPPIW